MASDDQAFLTLRCSQCAKKLKVPARYKGRRIKCPNCAHSQMVVTEKTKNGKSRQPAPQTSFDLDDIFSLSTPAINDVDSRKESSERIKSEKSMEREAKKTRHTKQQQSSPEPLAPLSPVRRTTAPLDEAPIPFDSDEELFEDAETSAPPEASQPNATSRANASNHHKATSPAPRAAQPRPARKQTEPERQPRPQSANSGPEKKHPASKKPVRAKQPIAAQVTEAKESVFDEDLPELQELAENADELISEGVVATQRLKAMRGAAGLDDLDDLIPDPDMPDDLPSLYENPGESEYRIVCKTCGTAQHVPPSAVGMKVKCPDCFDQFKVPPPPAGWNKKKPKPKLDGENMSLAPPEDIPYGQTEEGKKERTQALLDKAKKEISDDELERLYDHDFDTAGFVRRTFGFLTDVITVSQVIGYGLIFGGLFALVQFGMNDTESQFGRGLLLLTMVLAPMVAILFALPMLSGGLALIESVANKQSKVDEIPGFNMFDNFADVLVIGVALGASVVPGFMFGYMFSGDGDGYARIAGTLISCLALFPVFLLSMMDNGSMFQPISSAVLRSLAEAAEAWGGYYLKTALAFLAVLILWVLLLGSGPGLAAIAGFLLPLLVFFTCQQIGALADSIGDHLSFEFTAPESDDGDADEDTSKVVLE